MKEIISLTLSQDDRYIIAQEDYKSTKMWEFVPLQELIDRAKEQVERKNKTVLDIKIFTPEYGDGAGEDEDLDYDDE